VILIEGRILGKAIRGKKQLQMISDVISKAYEHLNRGTGDKSRRQKRFP